MGIVTVKLTVKNPLSPKKSFEGEFLVDTGAHYTVIPGKMAEKLGLKRSYTQDFSLADGKTIKRPIGSALVDFEGRELAVPVVIGQKGDTALLGITTLENFGLMIDPFKRKIYHSKLMLGRLTLVRQKLTA